MTEHEILEAMHTFGGAFVRALAELYRLGDPVNRRKLRATFADYFDDYQELARRAARTAPQSYVDEVNSAENSVDRSSYGKQES